MTFFLLLLLGAAPAYAADEMPPPVDGVMPATDTRTIRELQDRAFGRPELATTAPRQEGLMALSELGATVRTPQGQALTPEDKDALFSLLQRYRDELLKMGMDSAELQAQLTILESRSSELERRLRDLHPLDGLKIHGRFYSAFDDLHLVGNPALVPVAAPLGSPVGSGKPAGKNLRTQIGVVHGQLRFEGSRGPFSGMAQFDVTGPWGDGNVIMGFRRVALEMRTPVAVQFGDLDAALTPLTLWRTEQYEPFLPQVFAERRQRLRDDMLLQPDRWHLTGARVTTRAVLFGALDVDLESITALVGMPAVVPAGSPLANSTVYQYQVGAATKFLATHYNTYLEGWRVAFPFSNGAGRVSYNGTLFWDETSSVYLATSYRPMNSLVQTGRAELNGQNLLAEIEFASSIYSQPVTTTAADPLAGTALNGALGWKGDLGQIRIFGRAVSPGYHAAGAQGRTVDYSWQFLGPFLSENSQVGADGNIGLDPLIPVYHASRLNDRLIPPGSYVFATAGPGAVWQHLLPYGPGEDIDPYGPATPNRIGGGAELGGKLFNGALRPLATVEMFQNSDPVTNATGLTEPAFTLTRYRAGLELDLDPWLGWPLRFGAGYTMTGSQSTQTYYDASTGTSPTSGVNTSLIDGSVQWNAGKPIGLAVGYRLMTATGRNERVNYKTAAYDQWDILGVGGWWRPMDKATVDIVYSSGHNAVPAPSTDALEIDQFLTRLTVEF